VKAGSKGRGRWGSLASLRGVAVLGLARLSAPPLKPGHG
jgi:hypothetical protein